MCLKAKSILAYRSSLALGIQNAGTAALEYCRFGRIFSECGVRVVVGIQHNSCISLL